MIWFNYIWNEQMHQRDPSPSSTIWHADWWMVMELRMLWLAAAQPRNTELSTVLINYILYDNENDILQSASNIDSTGLYTNTLFADLALLAERWKTVHVPRAKCTGLNVLLLWEERLTSQSVVPMLKAWDRPGKTPGLCWFGRPAANRN